MKTNQTNTIDSQAYRTHSVLMTLDRYAEFYQLLSDSVMQFLSSGTGAMINIQSYLCRSIGGTLNSVRVVVSEGRINDGYALVRKYFDLVMLSVYLDLYLNDRHDEGAIAVEQVKDWLRGKKALPCYKSMKTYVAGSDRLQPVTDMLLKTDERYKAIRERCNGHMHYRDYKAVLLNDKDVYVDRSPILDQLERDVIDLFVMHLACIFFMNDHYMMSSDYLDYLECGMKPEEDSQYWVADFVQEIFNEVLKVQRPDICAAIRDQTSMHLD